MKWNKAVGLGMALFLWIGLSSGVKADWADDFFGAKPDDFIKSRSYVGGLGISSDIDQFGDFQGIYEFVSPAATTVSGGVTITSSPEAEYIPAITRNYGWGVLVGHREGPWAMEVSYWRTQHTATFAGSVTLSSPAALQAINFDFKRYFFTQVPTQPFISAGLSVPWLWIRGFSALTLNDPPNYTPYLFNDETISGLGLNLGVGLEIYLGDGFSLVGGANRRWTAFDQINGAAKVPNNNLYWDGLPSHTSSLAGDGFNFYVGTTVGME